MKCKSPMIISNRCRNIWQYSTSIYDKNCHQNEYTGNVPQYNTVYDKDTVNILNSEKLKAFPQRPGKRQGCPLSPLLFSIVLEILAGLVRWEKDKNTSKLGRSKIVIICGQHDYIYRSPWSSTKKLWE